VPVAYPCSGGERNVRLVRLTGIRVGVPLWIESIGSNRKVIASGRQFNRIAAVRRRESRYGFTAERRPYHGSPHRLAATVGNHTMDLCRGGCQGQPQKSIVKRHARSFYIRSSLN
jgi:hypothetical protein